MKKFYEQAPTLIVTVFANADVITTSYEDDNVGGWSTAWFGGNGGDNNA